MHDATSHSGNARRAALIAYGSETGNAQDVAEELGVLFERLRFETCVTELNDVPLKDLIRYDVVAISTSTTGQGELPLNARSWWKTLRSTRLQQGSLRRMNFVSFGLGDSSYPHYQHAHRKIFNRLLHLGANLLHERGEADEQHPDGVEGAFVRWSSGLCRQILVTFPLVIGVTPLAGADPLPWKWVLTSQSNNSDLQVVDVANHDLARKGTMVVSLEQNDRLTPESHWQDVRHLILCAATKHDYWPGDVLTIYPSNAQEDVVSILHSQRWAEVADVPLRLTQPNQTAGTRSPLYQFDVSTTTLTLRLLLTKVLDIASIPRRSLFAKFAQHCSVDTEDGRAQHERLLEFCDPEYLDELYDYTTRPRRSIVEVLQEFDSVRLPWANILEILPIIRGRQFSIASGGRLKEAAFSRDLGARVGEHVTSRKHATRFELIVAIVKYKTVIKRLRQGLCTRYLAELPAGTLLHVKLSSGSLGLGKPEQGRDRSPVIMVGPGTGIAPCRSLVHERSLWTRGSSPNCKDILFFGARNKAADFFFEEEWRCFSQGLDIYTAFSRDQKEKVYVQDMIRREALHVYNVLANENGSVVVCGSSGNMPKAVRDALLDVFTNQGSMRRAEAEIFMVELEKTGRYWQETW